METLENGLQLVLTPLVLVVALLLAGLVPSRTSHPNIRRAAVWGFWAGVAIFAVAATVVMTLEAGGTGAGRPRAVFGPVARTRFEWWGLVVGLAIGWGVPAAFRLARSKKWAVLVPLLPMTVSAVVSATLFTYVFYPHLVRGWVVAIALGAAVGFLVGLAVPERGRSPLARPTIMGW